MNNSKSISKICLVCGDIFYKKSIESKNYWARKKYCSYKCSLTKTSVQKQSFDRNKLKGLIPWNKGTKYSEKMKFRLNLSGLEIGRGFNKGKKLLQITGENNPNWKEKIRKNCEICNKEMLLPPWDKNRRFCNRKCWALGTRGIGSPVYKGDKAITPLRIRIMELPEYKNWRSIILKRDNYTCVLCREKRNLEVDHKKRFLHIINENNIDTVEKSRECKELWDIENGRTICRKCHRKTDTFGTTGLRKNIIS